MLTYLLAVCSAWFAWSKFPPLHPCCHSGNQPGQPQPRFVVVLLFLGLTRCLLSQQWILEGISSRRFSLRVDSPWSDDSLGFLSSFSKTHMSCSCLPAPLPLFCGSLRSVLPFFQFPASSWSYVVVACCYTNAVLRNNTTGK